MNNPRKIACRLGDRCFDELSCPFAHTSRTETLTLCPNLARDMVCKLGPLCRFNHDVALFDCSICVTREFLFRNSTKLVAVPLRCEHHFCYTCLQTWTRLPDSSPLDYPELFTCPVCHTLSELFIVGRKTSYSPTEKERLRLTRIPLKTRLPSCFAKEYDLHVDDYVMLRDANKNMFEVKVHKKYGKVYFRDGWIGLKDFYKIGLGAWVTLTYIESKPSAHDHKRQIRSNNCLPPISKMIIQSDGRPVMRFYRTFVHILTSSDIDSGYLVVPWFGFGEDALPTIATRLSIIDHYGNILKCDMVFIRMEDTVFCRIGGDWKLLCSARRLVKGHAIKFAVTENTRNGILHIRHVPLQCVHRGFVKSMNTSDARHVYQVNHYFI